MEPITMTLEQTKTTKGTTVFTELKNDPNDTSTRGHTFYLLKSTLSDPPATIQITITDHEDN